MLEGGQGCTMIQLFGTCLSRLRLVLLASALLLVAAFPAVSHADLDRLKREAAALERGVEHAVKAKAEADKALQENLDAQRNAQGDALARLKREAIALSARAHEAGESLRAARRELAGRQSELRGAAAKQAVAQIDDGGELSARVTRALSALSEWKGALGDLPQAPQPRDLSNVDEDMREPFRRTDIQRLKAFEDWSVAESNRIGEEITAADKLLAWKAGDSSDARRLIAEARALKATLQQRQRAVDTAAKASEAARRRLEAG
jgi:hypothetical protein